MTQEVPQLPEWVQSLLNAEKDRAYWEGWTEGRRHLWEQWKSKIDNWDPR